MDIIEKMHLNLEEYEHIQIRTVREFNNLAASINDSSEPKDTKKVYVTLENDIDFDGAGVQWIEKFEGIFNGQNFKIKNFVLSFPSKSSIGLFKKLDGAIVANLTLQDGTMNLGYSSGVFCRDASNSILFNCHVVNVELNKTNSSSCSSSALFVQSGDASFFCQCSVRGSSIKSDDSASGFIHSMNKGCMFIDCCTVDSSITSTTRDDDTYVSGFFGSSQYSKSNCDFINCYASASITTFSKDEGSRTSAFCLNPGEYSAINCYYDSETSGISHETTAAALTSEDILTHYQTALVGFDFENVWKIDETSGYPIPAGVIPEVVDMARDSGPIEEVPTQVTFIKNAAQCLAYINHPSFNTGLSSDGNWGYENGEYFLKHFAKSLGKSSFDVDFNLEEEKEISFYLEAYLESLSEKVTVSISNSDGVVVSRYYNGSHFTKFIHRLEPGDYRLTITFESTSDLSKDEYISLYHFENITIETTKGYFEYKIDDEGEWKKSLIPFIGAVPEGTHQIRSRFVSGDNISQEDCQSYDFQPIEYAGGDGTEGNPYLISKPQHLKLLEEQINNLQLETKDKFYKLTNDIDLSIYENWLPIGYLPSPSTNSGASGNYFRGTFDGNNHTIHNLTINRPLDSGLGLFGTMEDFCILGNHAVNPVIKNVKLRNVNIIGKDCVGSLVGYTYFYREYDKNGPSRLTINNCHVRKAKIIAGEKAGGFIGYSNYAISCSGSSAYNIEMDYNFAVGDSASRQGVSYCGGIIGYLNSSGVQVGRFDDCHVSKFTIKNGNRYLGGFVGMFYNAYACDCSAESVIEVIDGSGGNVGGFSGYSYASSYRDEDDDFIPRFERCDCKILMKPANPTAYISNIGGFTGYSSTFTFSKCRVIADVHGSGSTGGFVGYMSTYGDTPSLTDLLISCRITNPRENSSDVAPICGISASDDTKVSATRVYYDSEVCDAPARTIGTPLTTTQMMGQAATENTALDFASDWQVIDGDYPKLSTIIENNPFENIRIPNGWVTVGEQQSQTTKHELMSFVTEKLDAVDGRLDEIDQLINEVKSSVSDGKRLIASAITDKGVEASESDSFQVIAEKIAAITSSQSTVDVVKSSSDGKALELLGTTGDNFKKLSIKSSVLEDSVNSNRRPYVSLTIDNGTSADNSEHFNETVEIELPGQLLSCGSAANELIQNEDGTIKFIKRADVVDTSWEQIFSQSLEVVNKKWKSFLINEKIYIVGGSKYSSVTSHTPYEKVSIFDLNTKQWSAGTDIPSPTEDFASIAIGDKIYIISGYSNFTYSQSVYVYDTMTNQWEKKADYPLDGMGYMSCVYAEDTNCIYTCGGMGNSGRLNDKICKYDIASDSWTTLETSFPSDGLSENGRYGMLMGYLSGGYIVFISGKVKGSPNLTTRYLSVNQLSWSEMAEIPALTTAHSIIHNQQENSFYVANLGTRTDEESLVYRFNYSRNEWSVIGKMPVKASLDGDTFIHNNQYIVVTDEASTNSNSVIKCYRGDLPFTLLIDDEFTVEVSEVEEDERILTGSPYGTIVDDKLYCFGGRVPSGFFNGIHVYDFKAKTLVKKEGTNWKNGGFVHAIGNKLHLLGGALPNASYDTEHDVYNIETDEWTKATKPPVESKDYQSVLVDSKIYLLGGWLASDTVGDCYVYDASTDAWTSIAPMPNPVYGGSACYYNGKIYVTGGYESSGQYSPPFYPSKKMSVYDIATDTWESLGDCQVARINHSSIEHNGKIYLIGGDCYENTSSRVQSTFDIYDVATKTWESCYPLHVNGYSRLNFVRGGHLYMYGNCTDYNRETFLFTKMLISDRAKLDKEIVSEISLPTPFKTCKGFTRIQVTNLKKATIEATVSCFK